MDNEPVFKSILPIQVRFNDVDIMGHVSNTVYQSYYDSGKVDYFDKVMPDMDFVNNRSGRRFGKDRLPETHLYANTHFGSRPAWPCLATRA